MDGIVQGVGFRPFVHRLATGLGLHGVVGNDERGVLIEVEGNPEAVAAFTDAVRHRPPPLASVERVTTRPLPVTGEPGFRIVPSTGRDHGRALISPDVATCDDCLRELFDPADRRHLYPFINCTACGPRFTIVTASPYDRAGTTMAPFAMCPACAAEYHDPSSRRFHAQPVCCPACGPRLRLLVPAGTEDARPPGRWAEVAGDPIAGAANVLRRGGVLAVKGIGGYHLAVRADLEDAVATLRARKRRAERPFAVMTPTLATARHLCTTDPHEERLLTAPQRPIVLLARRHIPSTPRVPEPGLASAQGVRAGDGGDGSACGAEQRSGDVAAAVGPLVDASVAPLIDPSVVTLIAPSVAPCDRMLGVMLPYSPVHHLLLREFPQPIVLTSGNVSDEPIAYLDADALSLLGGLADAFLLHDRAIRTRADDSVVRVVRGREVPVRRSRGHVPRPSPLVRAARRPVLACGAELKHTFCLARGRHALVSQHIGDLENYETLRSFTEGVRHFERLFGIRPEVVAHDPHPEYLSTKYALERGDVQLVAVQHHHAHIASCLTDNGAAGPVIGVAFDGLGYGLDRTLWGGEFLVADLTGFRRAGHLATVPMPGGAAAIRQPWRMAAAYLADLSPSVPDSVRQGPTDGAAHLASISGRFPDGGHRDPADGAAQLTGLSMSFPDIGRRGHAEGNAGTAGLAVRERNAARWDAVTALAARAVNAPLTSSAGRLFDAVAAIAIGRDTVSYEGQAAVELERAAAPGEAGTYPCRIIGAGRAEGPGAGRADGGEEMFVAMGHDLVRAVVDDLGAGAEPGVVAARFHNGVARLIVEGCVRLREQTGLCVVALSGGVFQNARLVAGTTAGLEERGFTVLTHKNVPPNDGGISLGQAAVAAALSHPG
ncbi:carbamoyltransferase [Sphaerisporangium siamense]|uniref:carbamoyltransferase HypF n=1 Tax=Sphaerisporangium siamense TaxID=795645 RepID=UPI001A447CAE|nr:carbamoyltransferase HypF [Sphaerisporangium siamense]GII83697.1 carbamoyltransferase [Sphaerisporangium siamense]